MKWNIPNSYYVLEIPEWGQPKIWSNCPMFPFKKRKPMKGAPCNGYLSFGLRLPGSDGKMKTKQIALHRLVAEAVYGPCPEGKEVNHIDGHKLNNRPENLEYVTHYHNMKHKPRLTIPKLSLEQLWTLMSY